MRIEPDSMPRPSGQGNSACNHAAKINIYTLQPSIPSDGGIVTTASPHHSWR
ncbi:hypothetical protein AAH110_22900 [Phocaeicola dorei]|uniref:hypothetical protein n=1 Tax=Phocaeicola dorei TaxID=357276 RepID=UPI0039B3CA67